MGRAPCCDKNGLKKGPWTPEEDQKLIDYIQRHGHGSWRTLPKHAGLLRCGKSCRLRWTNYLRPDIKRGKFSFEEEQTIIQLHGAMGNKWSAIAAHLPGRTDNEIKNYWNTHLKKRLLQMGIDPVTHRPRMDFFNLVAMPPSASLGHFQMGMATRFENARLQAMLGEYLSMLTSAAMLHGSTSCSSPALNADQQFSAIFSNSSASPASLFVQDGLPSLLAEGASGADASNNSFNFAYDFAEVVGNSHDQTPSPQISACSLPTPSPTSMLYPLEAFVNKSSNSSGGGGSGSEGICQGSSIPGASETLSNETCLASGVSKDIRIDCSSAPIWPSQEHALGLFKTNSDSLPVLVSSTSSPNVNLFCDSELTNAKNKKTETSYDYSISPEMFLDYNAQKEEDLDAIIRHQQSTENADDISCSPNAASASATSPQSQNSEACRDYWTRILKFTSETEPCIDE